MGGIAGAALVYSQYIHAIDIFEGGRGIRTQGTAGLFATFAVCDHMSADNRLVHVLLLTLHCGEFDLAGLHDGCVLLFR